MKITKPLPLFLLLIALAACGQAPDSEPEPEALGETEQAFANAKHGDACRIFGIEADPRQCLVSANLVQLKALVVSHAGMSIWNEFDVSLIQQMDVDWSGAHPSVSTTPAVAMLPDRWMNLTRARFFVPGAAVSGGTDALVRNIAFPGTNTATATVSVVGTGGALVEYQGVPIATRFSFDAPTGTILAGTASAFPTPVYWPGF